MRKLKYLWTSRLFYFKSFSFISFGFPVWFFTFISYHIILYLYLIFKFFVHILLQKRIALRKLCVCVCVFFFPRYILFCHVWNKIVFDRMMCVQLMIMLNECVLKPFLFKIRRSCMNKYNNVNIIFHILFKNKIGSLAKTIKIKIDLHN